MSLGSIVRQIEDELQYAPDVREHRVDIRNRVARRYHELCVATPWPFLVRETVLNVFPDFTLPDGSLALDETDSLRVVQVNRSFIEGRMYPAAQAANFADFSQGLLGAELGLANLEEAPAASGNWLTGPFTIEQINLITPGDPVWELRLDPRCRIVAFTGGENAGFRVSFPRWRLQGDVDSVIELQDSDGRILRSVTERERTFLERPTVQTGRPSAWSFDSGLVPTHPPPHAEESAIAAVQPQNYLRFQRESAEIRRDIAATMTVGGGLTSGVTYRAFMTWFYSGRFGPPSNTVEVTATASNKTITFSSIPQLVGTGTKPTDAPYGWRLAIWVAEGDGPFYLVALPTTPTVAGGPTIAWGGSGPDYAPNEPWRLIRWDEQVPPKYQYIRLYPRPDSWRQLLLRYRARPRRLIADNDVPDFDEAFEDYLVWQVAADMSFRTPGPFYDRVNASAAAAFGRLSQRYLPREARDRLQKRQVGSRGVEAWKPTIQYPIDWNGDS